MGRMSHWRRLHWWALLICSTAILWKRTWAANLPFCQDQKVYILDLNEFASSSLPGCVIDNVAVVNPYNGVVHHPQAKLKERVHHKYGTHSAPWYLAEALRKSELVTKDINDADLVFVDSYCYYMWWLGWIHTRGREHSDSPADHLIAAYQKLSESARWKRNGGSDFVFLDPHPGIAQGPAGGAYLKLVCETFKTSMHIISERGQRNVCPSYWEMEKHLLIVPYIPNLGQEGQYAVWERPLKPWSERRTLLYSSTRCMPYRLDKDGTVINVGKKMRHDIAKQLATVSSEIMVRCKDPELGGRPETFDESLAAMQSAKFCLVLPGDSASTRQLGEMMMAGCLPVFLGPPYHTMTFHQEVDYKAIGLFYNVSEYNLWQTQTMHWEIHSTERPAYPQIPWFWVLEKEVYPQLNHIRRVTDLIPALRKIPSQKLEAMFQMMDSQRQLFVYYDHLTPRWTAVNAIISRICLMAGSKQKGQATSQAAGSMLSGSRATLVKQSSHDLRMAELSKLLGDKVQ